MNVLLLGSGGREHALAWKIAQSARLTNLFAAPGNPGIAQHARLVTLDIADHDAVVAWCQAQAIALVVVGPEAPLVDGLADSLRGAGIATFGPGRGAAQLEGSKGFTKDLCRRANIPTARYVRCASAKEALAALDHFPIPVVIKTDGLAAGKGVIIADTRAEADAAIAEMAAGTFGSAGAQIVVEEFMTGEEVSFFALSDGDTVIAFGSAQDHKRVGEGDTGPNTGGMGAYSPAPILTAALEAEVMDRIIRPTVATLAAEGTPYQGVLFAGLMLTSDGPKLIEYNARFGDPECQVLMSRLTDDLLDLLDAVAHGRLAERAQPVFAEQTALTVVLAAKGYPTAPEKGGTLTGIDTAEALAEALGGQIFHAGTALVAGRLVASGGRVLNVTGLGANVTTAQANAYAVLAAIQFPTGFYRRDIGWRELVRERN